MLGLGQTMTVAGGGPIRLHCYEPASSQARRLIRTMERNCMLQRSLEGAIFTLSCWWKSMKGFWKFWFAFQRRLLRSWKALCKLLISGPRNGLQELKHLFTSNTVLGSGFPVICCRYLTNSTYRWHSARLPCWTLSFLLNRDLLRKTRELTKSSCGGIRSGCVGRSFLRSILASSSFINKLLKPKLRQLLLLYRRLVFYHTRGASSKQRSVDQRL